LHGNADPTERRLALLVEYDGTAYHGSQYQENAPTVQGALERALGRLTSESIRVTTAGRTDAGVHASGQVASFTTRSDHSPETFVRGGNAILPADIAIRAVAEVPPGFNPRRHAVSRLYRYTIDTGATRSPLRRRAAWHIGPGLDIPAMELLAPVFEGCHDFAAFAPPATGNRTTTRRNVIRSALRQQATTLYFDVEANSFLPHMVRRMVGTLTEVGRHRLAPGEAERLISEAPPGAASITAPSRGLCLVKVRYESGLFDDDTNEDI
jgi:tRNA pseudouridine38-40 synthase